jgi:RNA polymerase sigma factor (sigma-70 family)
VNDAIALIEPIIPALRRYAHALTRDVGDADDLVQDCLERAIGRWGQRRADGNVRTWLFSILHNLAISRIRQARRRGRPIPLDDAPPAALAHPPGQDDAVRHGELKRALARLPDDQRDVLLLVSVEDLTYAEAAAILGVPVGTVMSRLSRAREGLRNLMDEAPTGRNRLSLRVIK